MELLKRFAFAAAIALGLSFAPFSFVTAAEIATISEGSLPREAHDTLKLIRASGSKFPHSQDGTEFGNREALLPSKGSGYYQEYTVHTPGASDRGARRIVKGQGGEFYYTDDHYRSFKRIQ